MGLFGNIKNVLNYVKPSVNLEPTDTKKRKGLLYRLKRHYTYRVKAEMETFRQALAAAENPLRPDRKMLYGLYKNIELDDQVVSQMRIAIATVKNAPFVIETNDKENKEAMKFFDSSWFRNLLKFLVETEFWGHTLLEFIWTKDGRLRDCIVIPREHVRPEYGDLLIRPTDTKGIEFRDKVIPNCIEFGNPYDLGLFNVLCIPVIRKQYSDTDWSVFSEKYGMPLLSVKTQSRQEAEISAKEEMAANFGANGYVILDDMDEINIIERKSAGDGHKVFLERINLSDTKISKIINGQTGVTDEKSYVGSAEVHERTLNQFTLSRLTDIQADINEKLMHYLIEKGVIPLNSRFKFKELQQSEIELQTDPKESKKKSLNYPY